MQAPRRRLPGANVPLLAIGVRLPRPLSRAILGRVIGGARGGKSPSLRLHLRGGASGPSEVAWLNGAVARAGARLGVPTPVNAALAALVEAANVDPALAYELAADPRGVGAWVAAGGPLLTTGDGTAPATRLPGSAHDGPRHPGP